MISASVSTSRRDQPHGRAAGICARRIYEHPEVVSEYLAQECRAARVLGPFPSSPLPQLQVSSFGVIPKRHQPGKWCLILDLSTEGRSVNDGIDQTVCSLQFISVDTIAEAVFWVGRGALVAKSDVQHAYRQIPVHPDDRPLLGMRWQGHTYIDATLPFGLRSAPLIFSAVADALEWVVRSRGVRSICHYIDDFIIVGAPRSDECALLVDQRGIGDADFCRQDGGTGSVFDHSGYSGRHGGNDTEFTGGETAAHWISSPGVAWSLCRNSERP